MFRRFQLFASTVKEKVEALTRSKTVTVYVPASSRFGNGKEKDTMPCASERVGDVPFGSSLP